MRLSVLASLALLPALAGCVTVGMMQELPPDDGRLALYAAEPDTLVAVAQETIRQQRLRIADTSQPDADTRVMIASRPPGLFSNGEYVRVRIARDSSGLMAVRVVSQSGYLLDWAHRDLAPRVFAGMDTQLGATALGPWPGTRVQAMPQGASAALIGRVARLTVDSLVLEGGARRAPTVLKISALRSLAISRGSYRHTREGALIGLLVGGVIGGFIGSTNTDSSDPFAGLHILAGVLLGSAAGGVVGVAAGASTRTEIWSPVPLH
jgi:hypothetical protein